MSQSGPVTEMAGRTLYGVRLRSAALLAAAAVLVAGCGESAYHYVSSSEADTYFKVPNGWRVFDEDEIFENERGLSPQQERVQRARQWITAFDGAPRPALANVSQPGDHPSGLARVFVLDDEDHDTVSLKSLRALAMDGQDPIEVAQGGDPNIEIVEHESITRDGGLRGVHVVINRRASEEADYVTTNYVGLVDNPTRRVYLLYVSCNASCYEEHEGVIEDIVESWTVKEE
jgi:hypothetical protein